jgi:hypothetical protein
VGTMHAEFMVFAGEQCSTWFFFHPTDSKLCIQMNHQYVNKALSECAAVHLAGREVSTHQQDQMQSGTPFSPVYCYMEWWEWI